MSGLLPGVMFVFFMLEGVVGVATGYAPAMAQGIGCALLLAVYGLWSITLDPR